jgi:uncharacterized protein YrrD
MWKTFRRMIFWTNPKTNDVRKGGISLRTSSSVIGLPVYVRGTGQEVGKITDICFNSFGNATSFCVDQKGWFNGKRILPLSLVASIGKDSIMVDSHQTLSKLNKNQDEYLLSDYSLGLLGKQIYTSDGDKLGLVEDVYFMEEVGTIVGYEVTDGFFADIAEGKKVVYSNYPPAISKDAVVVQLTP